VQAKLLRKHRGNSLPHPFDIQRIRCLLQIPNPTRLKTKILELWRAKVKVRNSIILLNDRFEVSVG
jgi:hypothetical protein